MPVLPLCLIRDKIRYAAKCDCAGIIECGMSHDAGSSGHLEVFHEWVQFNIKWKMNVHCDSVISYAATLHFRIMVCTNKWN